MAHDLTCEEEMDYVPSFALLGCAELHAKSIEMVQLLGIGDDVFVDEYGHVYSLHWTDSSEEVLQYKMQSIG